MSISFTERGHRQRARVGASGSDRGQSPRARARGAEGPVGTDQRDRPRERAAQEGGGHSAFQSSHVGHGEIAVQVFTISVDLIC